MLESFRLKWFIQVKVNELKDRSVHESIMTDKGNHLITAVAYSDI